MDQLLEYHFEEDMTRLTQHCGKKLTNGRQTIIVSATLKQDVSASMIACHGVSLSPNKPTVTLCLHDSLGKS